MSYTISNATIDREHDKFLSPVQGSRTAMATSAHDRIKTYKFPLGSLTSSTGAGSGLFDAYSDEYMDGTLRAIAIEHNEWEDTGSLYLYISGYSNFSVWSLKSGTATSSPAVSGVYIPKAIARTTDNTTLSGTNAAGMNMDIPLYGYLRLVGSGLGDDKSCSGLIIVYS